MHSSRTPLPYTPCTLLIHALPSYPLRMRCVWSKCRTQPSSIHPLTCLVSIACFTWDPTTTTVHALTRPFMHSHDRSCTHTTVHALTRPFMHSHDRSCSRTDDRPSIDCLLAALTIIHSLTDCLLH
jgi:hypothetical protein